jgi:hypothetical protein
LYPAVEALFLLDWPGPWDKAVAASLETVENHNVSHPGMPAAVHILTRFVRSDQKAAVAGMKRLASSGVLTARLEEAVNADLDQVVARLIYLILINKASVRLPRSWSSVLERRPELVSQIDAEFRWKDDPAHVDRLIQAVREAPNFESVVKAVVAVRLQAYGHMGHFAVEDAVADPTTFLDAVGPDLEEPFVKGLTLYDSFWKLMDEATFDEGRIRLVRLLITNEDPDQEEEAQRARKTGSSSWRSPIASHR